MFRAGKRILRKTITHKLSRLWPWNALQNTARTSKKKKLASTLVSAPITHGMRSVTFKGSAVSESRIGRGINVLRIFTFSELKAATRNFGKDTVIGEGGFGIVYRGWIDAKSAAKAGKSLVAVKRLNPESLQGYEEWQCEVNFLGKLSHPNLVNLLGYCHADKEVLLVYEYLSKGSLHMHLFRSNEGGPGVDPLQWGKRLKILIGVARGLAFLHALDTPVIYRDFKSSNILLDESYNAKLGDFGLAKLGPTESCSHVSTRVMGTYGYAAPEYVGTGHLSVTSDVYGFGVVLLEMLTGLRAIDSTRPPKQTNLVEWLQPRLRNKRKVKNVVDSRLGGRYPAPDAVQIARLALNCLEHEPRSRPSMQEIVDTLERMDSAVETPRQPRVSFG